MSSETQRCFIALDIGSTARAAISGCADKLRANQPHVSWVSPQSWHLTLKFLGDINAEEISVTKAALECLGGLGHIEFSFLPLQGFPNAKRARVLSLGITDKGRCSMLAAKLEAALIEGWTTIYGNAHTYPREERAFTPHITLARIGRAASLAVPEISPPAGKFAIAHATLFKSRLTPQGAEHTALHRVNL